MKNKKLEERIAELRARLDEIEDEVTRLRRGIPTQYGEIAKLRREWYAVRDSLDILTDIELWINRKISDHERGLAINPDEFSYVIRPDGDAWIISLFGEERRIISLAEAVQFAREQVKGLDFKEDFELIQDELKEHGIGDLWGISDDTWANKITGRIARVCESVAVQFVTEVWKDRKRRRPGN